MAERVPASIKRGRLSDAELAEIVRLATTMTNPTPASIARKLNRHPSTVSWQLIKAGLRGRPRAQGGRGLSYVRNGRRVHRFDDAEDRRLEALRESGMGFTGIAQKLNAEFGRNRTAHAVHVRLTMLAAYAEAGDV